MKKLLLLLLLTSAFSSFAQQFALYNTRTLYDSFENPSQKSFIADTTKKYAFNFLIPTLGGHTSIGGPAQLSFKKLAFQGIISGSDLELGKGHTNEIFLNSNNYIAMFRIFKAVRYNREMGFAWQINSDTFLDVTNETIAIFKNFKNFNQLQYSDPFTNKGSSQSYHQFSFNYREDINKRLGVGVKLSYLSGIAYNKLDIKSSSILINTPRNSYNLTLGGKFKSNYLFSEVNENGQLVEREGLLKELAWPGFKNPGIAFTASANYKLRNGWYLLGNLKDMGFIHWSKKSYKFDLNKTITINNASSRDASSRLGQQISRMLYENYDQKGFTSVINGKAELLINKDFGQYQPNLLFSKNLLNRGTDYVLINNFKVRSSNFSLSTGYNTNKFSTLGAQYMLKKPNYEFFLGSDNVFKSYYFTKGMIKQDPEIGKGYTGASIYLGFSLKYGPDMEHPMNANNIPGFSKEADGPGFFKRLFSKKQKK